MQMNPVVTTMRGECPVDAIRRESSSWLLQSSNVVDNWRVIEGFFTPKLSERILNPKKKILEFFGGFFGFFEIFFLGVRGFYK